MKRAWAHLLVPGSHPQTDAPGADIACARPRSRSHTDTRTFTRVVLLARGVPKLIRSIHWGEGQDSPGLPPPRPLPRGAKHPLTHRLPHTASAEPSCIRQRCHSGRREERRVTSHPALGSSDKKRRFWGAPKRGGETFIH